MKTDFLNELTDLQTKIESCKTFDEKLNEWAQFAVEYCNNVAKNQIDRTFYAFQSKPIENPEVLILGLNPHGKADYQSQVKSDKWGLKEYGEMIPKVFIQQNPCYTGGKYAEKDWKILKNLEKTIEVEYDLRNLFDKRVYMNILYFNSNNFSEFQETFKEHWKEVYENCICLSSLLIFDIIKPNKILCLGIESCFEPLIKELPKPLIKVVKKIIIKDSLHKYTKDDDCVIYGMTHPSAPKKSDMFRADIGWHLYADCFDKPIFESLEKKLQTIEIILSKIAEKYTLELDLDISKLNNKFGFFKFYRQNETEVSFYFEFQKPFYSDLYYGVNNITRKLPKYFKSAKNCNSLYANWMTLSEEFNQEDFERYFDDLVKNFIQDFSK